MAKVVKIMCIARKNAYGDYNSCIHEKKSIIVLCKTCFLYCACRQRIGGYRQWTKGELE